MFILLSSSLFTAVTGNSPKIEEVLQEVDSLAKSIESINFDVFDRRYQTSWETELKKFMSTSREVRFLLCKL